MAVPRGATSPFQNLSPGTSVWFRRSAFHAIASRHPGETVAVVGHVASLTVALARLCRLGATVWGTPLAHAHPFLVEHKYSYPILLDPGRKVNELFGISGIPKSFLYGRDENKCESQQFAKCMTEFKAKGTVQAAIAVLAKDPMYCQ